MRNASIVIFDIDGTLADCSHRAHHLQEEPKNWEAFFAGCVNDDPIRPVVDLAKNFFDFKQVVFITGRSAEHRPQTVAWLSAQLGRPSYMIEARLYMRSSGDRRQDSEVKLELLEQMLEDLCLPASSVWGIFEDRLSCCEMWVKEGFFVFDVSQGRGDF